MEPTLWAGGVVACAGLAFLLLFRRLLRPAVPPSMEWLADFTTARYRPMLRLFDREDYQFLAAQAGFRPGIAGQLRKKRRRVFRYYLRNLRIDFNRLQAAAKLCLLHAPEDRPDFALALLKLRSQFWCAMLCAYGRLALEPLGVKPSDVRGLLGSLESLSHHLPSDPARLALAYSFERVR